MPTGNVKTVQSLSILHRLCPSRGESCPRQPTTPQIAGLVPSDRTNRTNKQRKCCIQQCMLLQLCNITFSCLQQSCAQFATKRRLVLVPLFSAGRWLLWTSEGECFSVSRFDRVNSLANPCHCFQRPFSDALQTRTGTPERAEGVGLDELRSNWY